MVIFNEMKHVSPAGLGKQQLINRHAGNVADFALLSELLFLLSECRRVPFTLVKVQENGDVSKFPKSVSQFPKSFVFLELQIRTFFLSEANGRMDSWSKPDHRAESNGERFIFRKNLYF